MIVIATNNGKEYLINLLNSLEFLEINIPISIIDTKSNNSDSLEFIDILKSNNPYKLNISVYSTPYRGYDTGAYIYAIKNIPSTRYIFLQDSIEIKSNIFFEIINSKLEDNVIVPLISFNNIGYDNIEEQDFCLKNFDTIQYNKGIFGPMFAVTKKTIDLIDKKYLICPTTKNEQMAMERGWAIIFEKYNFKINEMEFFDYDKICNDKYSNFKKIILQRT